MGPWGHQALEVLGARQEISLGDQRVREHTRSEKVGDHAEIRPGGVGQQHLVARFEQGSKHQVERLDAPLGDYHLICARLAAVAPGDFVGQGFAQLWKARVGGVASMARPRRPVGSVDDVRRSRKVGLSHLEVDDPGIFPGQLHDLAYARDGHGTRDR